MTALEMRAMEKTWTYHSGLKLAGALMSHNSLFLSCRPFVRVLLHGMWQNDTKSAGHWYMVVFLAVRATQKNRQIMNVLRLTKSHTVQNCFCRTKKNPTNIHLLPRKYQL